MNEEQQAEIRELCEPIMEAAGDYVKAVVIYGSATRKDRVEGSDIDILVLVDDTKKGFDKEAFNTVKDAIDDVKDDADMDLHFQPPKPLSQWWDLLISGEPWAVTSMEDAQAIYDPSDYIRLTQQLLDEGAMHGTEERAQRLMKRSRKKVRTMRQLLLEDVTAELLKAMTEAAQAVLMYYGRPPPSPDDVGEELRKNFVEGEELLSPRAVEDYRDFYELTERVDHGTLTEFSGRELDTYLNQAMAFIKAMAALFDKLETEKQEGIITESHQEAVEVCREALEEAGVDVPTEDAQVLNRFKEEFVDAGRVSEGYWELVMEIEEKKDLLDAGKLGEMSEEEIYSSRVNLREFETALTNILEHGNLPAMLDDEDGKDEEGPMDAVKGYCDALLDEYEDVVKAVWLLSREDLKETHGVTVVILYNDLDASETHTRRDLHRAAQRLSEETRTEKGLDIHPTFYDLTDYWNLVRHGSPVTFSEIREGIPVYDPGGFFLPLKKLLSQGKIPGTKEAMRSLIGKAPRRVIKVKKTYKAQIVEQLYNAVVDAGQAALIVNGVAPPVQKKLPGALRTHLVPDMLTERDVDRCEDVITFWKDFEHGDVQEIGGDDIDRILEDTVAFIEDAEAILEHAD